MSADKPQPMSIEQRYLQLQRAMLVDMLSGSDPDPTNYVLTTTPEDFEVYLDECNAGVSDTPATDTDGLSPGGPVGDGSLELPG